MILPEAIQRAANRSRWGDAIYRRRAQDVLRKSQIHRHLPMTGRLLDLGCGLGYVAEAILQDAPGRTCVMMDPVASPSPRVKSRIAPSRYEVLKASGLEIPFPDATFDGAYAAFVLHHVPFEGQQIILREIVRVLRPGSTFVLLEDTPSNPREATTTLRADRRLNFEPVEAPHHYRSPAEWRADLPGHGFVIRQEIAFSRVFPPATLRAVHHRTFVCARS